MKKFLHSKTLRRSFLALLCSFFLMQVAKSQCPAGATWTSRTSAADNTWRSITYGNGVFVAVAESGTGNRVMTSPDGITWTSRTSAADNQWYSVTYGNGLFVAVAVTGTGNRVMTSPDGITWTIRTSAVNNLWTSVTYGNGVFVAVATSGTGNRVMTSPDGITWTSRTSAADNQWYSVTYGNGLFVAVAITGTGNRIMTSPDGITWTIRNSAADNFWYSVTYGNDVFVAVASSGTGNRVMTSLDGITWTSRSSAADNSWISVTYGNGVFVAVAFTGTNNRVMTSPDGITWTIRTSAANNVWRSVTYGNGVFVAVSNTGAGNRVMTSAPPLVTPSVTIAANPGNSITTGTSVTFTATPTNGGTTPAYQWKKNNNNVGSNSVTYTDAALENGDIITCELTSNNPCASTATATSSGITMVVANPSSNANLSTLTISSGNLDPAFDSGTLAYTAIVTNATTSITVTSTRADANATITVNGTAVASGTASGSIALTVGSNTITTIVTAQNGTTKTYTTTVTRAKADQTITFPAFAAKTTTSPDFEPGASVDSGLPLTYTSSNQLVATVYQDNTDGGKWKIRILTEGTTDIEATQAGNANYNSTSFTKQLEIGGTLPVSLFDYQAKIQNNKEVLLSWVTSSEINNAGFEIWKSINGKSFEKRTFVKGAGNSTNNQVYKYLDLSPNKGENYYKLVQLDKDGVSKEVGLKSVRFELGSKDMISVYPNPTSDLVNTGFEAGLYQTLKIIDIYGKVLVFRDISLAETKANFSLSAFPDAVYILQLSGKNGVVTKQIVKK